jgi:hypothetical protein
MRIGWGAVYDTVFASSSAMPRSVFVAPVEPKKARVGKKNNKDGKSAVVDDEDDAYAPPEDDASGNGD